MYRGIFSSLLSLFFLVLFLIPIGPTDDLSARRYWRDGHRDGYSRHYNWYPRSYFYYDQYYPRGGYYYNTYPYYYNTYPHYYHSYPYYGDGAGLYLRFGL